MQYGVDISTYKRIGNKKTKREISLKDTPIRVIISGVIALLLGRVILSVSPGVGIAPFGLAYILGKSGKSDIKEKVAALSGVLLGYISIYRNMEGISIYCISTVVLFIYIQISSKFSFKKKDIFAFGLIFITFYIFNFVLYKQPTGVNITFSLIRVLSIVPVYYILKYALNCTDELETNYFFSTEELISIGILVCLLVSGIGNIGVAGIALRNIIALATVIFIGYVSGVGLGTAMGVTMGFIIGITNNNVIMLISLYSVCGLIVGVFKDTGRIFSAVSYLTMYFIITMYSESFGIIGGIEAVIAAVVLIAIPKGFIDIAIKEVNQDKKAEVISDIHLKGIKDEFVGRINDMKGVLGSLSTSISNLVENDILSLNNKGTAMVESLADRTCYNCELKNRCWDRNLHATFGAFSELISSCEDSNILFPDELEKRCVKKQSLIKNSQEIVNNYTVNEALKSRLAEGRNIIATHINNMALTMGEIVRDFNKDISICTDIDRILRKALNKNNINYKDVFCYLDRKGRLKIKITLSNCGGANYCAKNILPIVNALVKIPVSISGEGCRIDPDTDECAIIIEETPKYHMVSYAATNPKEGESYIGDSYSFGKNDDGTYLTIVSDGMGSGPEAGIESGVAVELIEKFISSGFSDKTAINTVNSIMGMKFSEDEKFTTLDLNIIDLYTGEAEFMKIGGVVSFIKSGDEVQVIKSQSLPFGILDNVDVDTEKKKLKHGDIIVTISDGVLDIDKNNVGSFTWLEEYLHYADNNPDALSRDILEKAKVLSGGRVWDDMTVVVSKLYSVY
ncbi:stage II sporulation protein E [Clostridium carnis]